MNAALIISIVALVVALAAGLLAVANLLALGHLARLHEALKQSVRGVAGAADAAFKSDRERIFSVERFLIRVFEIKEVLGKDTGDTNIEDNMSKKDGGFKN